MRAQVERNTASGTDAHGHPVAASFSAHATLACFVWSKTGREIVDGEKIASIDDMRAMFPLDADIEEGDEIASVTDRQGTEIIAGRLRIDAPPQRRHRHLEAVLRRVS